MIGAAERAAVDRVLTSGILTQGAAVEQFEERFSDSVGGRHCVAVASGTAALQIALAVAGIGPGDEVILPSLTFAATANAVLHCGALPVFVDIDAKTFCLDPQAVAAAVTARTAAVVPVHLYGHPAEMTQIDAVARRHGLLVVEDACQAQGATYRSRPAGALADLAAISFYPSKAMTTGEGGMLVCADADTAAQARAVRTQRIGRTPGDRPVIGQNARLSDIGAAIGLVQLGRVAQFLALRRANAKRWDAALPDALVPHRAPEVEHSYHLYTIRLPDRASAQAMLTSAGIESRVYYDPPLHRSPPHTDLAPVHLPETDAAAASVLSIPVGPHLDEPACDRIAAALALL